MRDLVPFAATLFELVSADQRVAWLDRFSAHGALALSELGLQGDRARTLRAQTTQLGLLAPDGSAQRVRVAQLVLVMDIIEALPERPTPPPMPEPLVFTVPPRVQQLISPSTRLDVLVTDVIARAGSTLHIGGPFWNEGGWHLLEPVLIPALEQRAVAATFYLHPHRPEDRSLIQDALAQVSQRGSVTQRWWAGGYPSLMHAKFVVADSSRGYFESANLTSLGMQAHLEMGVALQPQQSASLLALLAALEEAGLFTPEPCNW